MASNPYENTVYPAAADTFQELSDADTPENTVYAKWINKLQKAVAALQEHTLYSARGIDTHGPQLYTLSQSHTFSRNAGSRIYRLRFEVEAAVLNRLFDGTPFHRRFGILASLTGYRYRGGQREYHRTMHALEPVDETATAASLICWKREEEWKKDDTLEAQLQFFRID